MGKLGECRWGYAMGRVATPPSAAAGTPRGVPGRRQGVAAIDSAGEPPRARAAVHAVLHVLFIGTLNRFYFDTQYMYMVHVR